MTWLCVSFALCLLVVRIYVLLDRLSQQVVVYVCVCILFVCACAVVCAVEFIPTFKVVIVVVMCRDVCRVCVRGCVCC